MKKRLVLSAFLGLLLCFALFSPTASAEAAPTAVTLGNESAEEILSLAEIDGLRTVDGRASTEYAALLQLRALRPDCDVFWEVPFQGERYPSDTESLTVTDKTGLEDVLPYLPALKEVDLLKARAVISDLDRYHALRPDVFYLWEFYLEGARVRTDTRVYSSLHGADSARYDERYYYPLLTYCPYLKALDLGHNVISDVTMIGDLKDLQVLILADNTIRDASPLGNLENLVYLELFINPYIEDFSFLGRLTRLRDLNLCYCRYLDNLDFLDSLPELSFLMYKRTAVPEEEQLRWQEARPDVKMVFYDGDPESTGSGWRQTGRNQMIRTAFSHWYNVVRYDAYNDMEFKINGGVYPITDFYTE